MPVRHIKSDCLLNYSDRVANNVEWPELRLVSGSPEFYMRNGKHEHLALFYIKQDITTHHGRVVAKEIDYSVRIMSDVWADLSYVVVYEPTREHTGAFSTERDYTENVDKPKGPCGFFRRILVQNSEFASHDDEFVAFEIDASNEIKELYETYKKGLSFKEKERSYNHEQERILRERKEVSIGKWVRVVKGRNVEHGTTGKVFWIGQSQWGQKIGIAIPNNDGTFRMNGNQYANVVWTYGKNVAVVSGMNGRVL